MTERTREEHLKWCIERAIAEMDFTHEPQSAIVSMMSDLRKHPETNKEALIALCGMQLVSARGVGSRQEVINFLKGFN